MQRLNVTSRDFTHHSRHGVLKEVQRRAQALSSCAADLPEAQTEAGMDVDCDAVPDTPERGTAALSCAACTHALTSSLVPHMLRRAVRMQRRMR